MELLALPVQSVGSCLRNHTTVCNSVASSCHSLVYLIRWSFSHCQCGLKWSIFKCFIMYIVINMVLCQFVQIQCRGVGVCEKMVRWLQLGKAWLEKESANPFEIHTPSVEDWEKTSSSGSVNFKGLALTLTSVWKQQSSVLYIVHYINKERSI